MQWYLLKSSSDREKSGDVIIDLSQIESVRAIKVIGEKEIFYQVKVNMKSEDHWLANFNNEDETKNCMKDLGIPEDIVKDYLIQVRDIKKEKEEKMKEMLEQMVK